jgi:membrane protease YdiL (CAAX protease family)
MSTSDAMPSPDVPAAPVGAAPIDPQSQPEAPRPPRGAVIPGRPFGAHVRTRWWAPIAVLVSLMVIMFGAQIVLGMVWVLVTIALKGPQAIDQSITPGLMLLTNLSLALLIPCSLLAMRWIAGVPWRAVLSAGRCFSWGRLLRSVLVVLGLFALGLGAAALVTPELRGPDLLRIGSSTIPLLVVALLTTPIQAAGEEIMFRGTLLPLLGSWIRARRGALVLGTVLSTVLFGLVHGATDPWLALYYTGFGLCGALLALATGGLEAPIAFHAGNNLIFMVMAALSAGDGGLVIDRSAAGGAGGPWVLAMLGLDLVVVAVLAILGRRRNRCEGRGSTAEVPANGATRTAGE